MRKKNIHLAYPHKHILSIPNASLNKTNLEEYHLSTGISFKIRHQNSHVPDFMNKCLTSGRFSKKE